MLNKKDNRYNRSLIYLPLRQFVLKSWFRISMSREVFEHQFISSLRVAVAYIWYWIYHKKILHDQEHCNSILFVHNVDYTYVVFNTAQSKNINKANKYYNANAHKTQWLDQVLQKNIYLVYTFKHIILPTLKS